MFRLTAIALAIVGLIGCDGSGDHGTDDDGTVAPPEFPTYAAAAADSMLLPVVTAAGELHLFDPATPDVAPLVVDSGLPAPTHFGGGNPLPSVSLKLLPGGQYDSAQNVVADQHYRFAWYQKGGALYRVDLLKTSGTHAPVQISSVTGICFVSGLAVDYANPLNSRLSMYSAGGDASCGTGDDQGHYVAFGASPADPGIAVPVDFEIFEWIPAPDGSVQRLIVWRHSAAVRAILSYAPDLSSSTELVAMDAFTWLWHGPDSSRTRQYFGIEPADGTPTLYRYDADTDAMTPLYVWDSEGFRPLRADGDHLYFVGNDSLYRVGHASTTPEPLAGGSSSFILTPDRIVYVGSRPGGSSLESAPKSDPGTYTVLEPASLSGVRIMASVGTRVYYDRAAGTAGGSAHVVNEDGTGASAVPNAAWLGRQRSPDDDMGGLDPSPAVRTMLLGAHVPDGLAIRGVDAQTGIEGPVLGTIPDSTWALTSGFGRYVLLGAFVQRGGGAADFDAYFADIATAGSLRAAATTAGQDDGAPLLESPSP